MQSTTQNPDQNIGTKVAESAKTHTRDHIKNIAPPPFTQNNQPIHYKDIILNRHNAKAIIEKSIGVWNKYAQEENKNPYKEKQLELLPRDFEQILAENKLKLIRKKLAIVFHPDTNENKEAENFIKFINDILDKFQSNYFANAKPQNKYPSNQKNNYSQNNTYLNKEKTDQLKKALKLLEKEVMKIINNIFIQKRWNQAQIQDYLQNSQVAKIFCLCTES